MKTKYYSLMLLLVVISSCSKTGIVNNPVQPDPPVSADTLPSLATVRSWLVDKNASTETAALFYNLKKIAKSNILFGHQDDTKRGVTNASAQWANEQQFSGVSSAKSDVRDAAGAYPAVYGHDYQHIADFLSGNWFDYEKTVARQLTIEAYNRGGVNTYSWHYDNPVSKTDGSFYWANSPVEAVSKILPGGTHNDVFKASLKEVADYAKTLIGADGKLVPVIFRPFHEFDGDWFWWGASHCSAADYKAMYQFTVTYLRDSMGVHNFIYAWSPDKNFTTLSKYMERYPGNEYVDLVGNDNYGDVVAGVDVSVASNKLKIVSDYAAANNKIAALTETGLQNVTQNNWYTNRLQAILKYQQLELAYVLVWANTLSAFWTPYVGHPAQQDFINFKNNGTFIFGDRVPQMYKLQ